MNKLPNAQRRVLHRVARANNKGFLWWKCAFLHDMEIFRKLVKRGYATEEWDHHKSGGKMLVHFLTPKGWAASDIKPTSDYQRALFNTTVPFNQRTNPCSHRATTNASHRRFCAICSQELPT